MKLMQSGICKSDKLVRILGDFGISRIVGIANMEMASTIGKCTEAYAASEQLMKESIGSDHRADIYSLGLTLYELSNENHLPFASSGYVHEEEIQLRLAGVYNAP